MKFKISDFLIVFTISLLVFGNIGGAYQPIRLYSIFLLPFVFKEIKILYHIKSVKYLIDFFLLWLLYDLFSLLWTVDTSQGIKEFFCHLSHFNLLLLLFKLSMYSSNPIKFIYWGWIIFIVTTVPIALFELIFDVHLPISNFESERNINIGDGVIIQKFFSSVTFGNYNTYITVLCMSLVVLYSIFFYTKRRHMQLFILSAIITYIIFLNASRGGILVWFVLTIIFLFYYLKKRKISKFKILISGTIIVFVVIHYANALFSQIVFRLANESFIEDTGRLEIYLTTWRIFIENSKGIGLGIGSIMTWLQNTGLTITIPHNLWLEVLSQYGFIILFLLIVFMYKNVKSLRASKLVTNRFIGTAVLYSFLPLSLINSGYLLMPTLWVFFATLLIFSHYNYD